MDDIFILFLVSLFFFLLIVCRHRVEIDIPDGRFSATEQVAASR